MIDYREIPFEKRHQASARHYCGTVRANSIRHTASPQKARTRAIQIQFE